MNEFSSKIDSNSLGDYKNILSQFLNINGNGKNSSSSNNSNISKMKTNNQKVVSNHSSSKSMNMVSKTEPQAQRMFNNTKQAAQALKKNSVGKNAKMTT